MIIYHGSDKIIQIPDHRCRNHANDYGSGFYCTEEQELAKEWACKKGKDGFANRYDLNTDGLNICNLNSEDYNILNWLALLTKYRGYWQKHTVAEEAKDYLQRNFLPDISGYDVIVGYRADDSYFSFAQDFIMGTISLEQLSHAMKLGKLGEQVVLKSEKAFKQISYLDNEIAPAQRYFQKKINRDLEARRSYSESKRSMSSDDIYILDILRGDVKADDLRIR